LKYNHHYDGQKMLSDIKRPQGQAAWTKRKPARSKERNPVTDPTTR
jgi:hypothetical protein